MNDGDRTIVIASTYAQFLFWLDNLKDQKTRLQYIFVSSERDLLGHDFNTPLIILEPTLSEIKYIKLRALKAVAAARFVNITYERT